MYQFWNRALTTDLILAALTNDVPTAMFQSIFKTQLQFFPVASLTHTLQPSLAIPNKVAPICADVNPFPPALTRRCPCAPVVVRIAAVLTLPEYLVRAELGVRRKLGRGHVQFRANEAVKGGLAPVGEGQAVVVMPPGTLETLVYTTCVMAGDENLAEV